MQSLNTVAAATLVLVAASVTVQAQETCWSILKSKFGSEIAAAIDMADPCKDMPGGFDVTKTFKINSLDICTALNGVKIKADTTVACRTGNNAFIQASIEGGAEGEVEVDIGACKITNSQINIKGDIGQVASNTSTLQTAIRDFGQKKLDEICRPTM
ncbi:hypothetical protein CN221_27370 [Sinorhizobium meliloti]|uniref:hypothetical protein n=1 Tax=Rhizobium meliloti TaxID=382 RepID=UPI000FE13951|nr:hypothetical protein [Sinorhizobium meliloti]RVG88458.1 hypothetical protein CN221_27370 [Sinorhizobium meliloti]RVH60021.1 hypothetical protein CN209_25550 [Sinorhizobium meliloti]